MNNNYHYLIMLLDFKIKKIIEIKEIKEIIKKNCFFKLLCFS